MGLWGLIKYRVWVKWVIVFGLFNKVYKSGIGSARMLRASDLKRGVQMTHMTHKIQLSHPVFLARWKMPRALWVIWVIQNYMTPMTPKFVCLCPKSCLCVAELLTNIK